MPRPTFEDKHGEGSLDRMRAMLANPCWTYQAIGERFGRSREWARQVARKMLPDPSLRLGRDRIKERTSLRVLANVRYSEHVLRAWREAKSHRLKVKEVQVPGQSRAYSRRLEINGKLCDVLFRRKPNSFNSPSLLYFNFRITTKFPFHLLMIGDGDVYVVPNRFVPKDGYRTVYISARPSSGYHNIHPKIDWRRFKGAWNLLR